MTSITRKTEKQKGAEAEVEGFRRDLGPFVVTAQTTRMPMVFTDAKAFGHPIIFANDSFLSATGYDREEVLGKRFSFLLADDADPKAQSQLQASFEDGPDGCFDASFHRKDGAVFWAAVFISPVRSETGEIVQHFASFLDVSRHIQEEEHLRFLLNELNHRTQNTLATVQAIAAQTLRDVADRDVVETFEGRLVALSKAHSLLGRENWQAVSLPRSSSRSWSRSACATAGPAASRWRAMTSAWRRRPP